jgi:hypothetical protein
MKTIVESLFIMLFAECEDDPLNCLQHNLQVGDEGITCQKGASCRVNLYSMYLKDSVNLE